MNVLKVLLAVLAVLAMSVSMQLSAKEYYDPTDDENLVLTEAIGTGDLATVKVFVEDKGIDINDGHELFAWPPLLMAAGKNQTEIVKYLADRPDVNLDYRHPATKWTAFMHAAFFGNGELVKYLADKGADVNLKTKGNMSIVRVVREEGNTKMVDLLTSLGVKDDGCQAKECF